ncbi:hypothetical protein V3C99_007266 [Haemonchus contortus]
MSSGEVYHAFAHYVMIGSYKNTENHLMGQDFCVYWQMLPTVGMLFSSLLLLNVAIDRVLSAQKFYNSLIKSWYTLYISIHIATGVVFSFGMEAWIFYRRTSELYVVCYVTAPFYDMIHTVFFATMTTFSILILLCYVALIFFIRKTHMSGKLTFVACFSGYGSIIWSLRSREFEANLSFTCCHKPSNSIWLVWCNGVCCHRLCLRSTK